MRSIKWLVLTLLVASLPVVVSAQDQPSDTDITTQAGSGSDTGGISFNPFDNFIGDPDDPETLTTGTLAQLTFLSGGDDPVTIAVRLINLSLSFLGLLSVIFMLYAGVKWFTARDNEEEVTKAKDILKGALVGLVIVLGSMGAAQLIFNLAVSTTSEETDATSWMDWIATPAYAEDEQPTYKPEELPFDSYNGSTSDNVAIEDYGVMGPYLLRTQLGSADPVTITIAIINTVLTLLGMAFMALMLYAGVLWVTARGNEEQITKAKTTIIRAVIGLAIVLSAYGVSALTFRVLREYTVYGQLGG